MTHLSSFNSNATESPVACEGNEGNFDFELLLHPTQLIQHSAQIQASAPSQSPTSIQPPVQTQPPATIQLISDSRKSRPKSPARDAVLATRMQRPRCLPFMSTVLAITYLPYLEMYMHYEFQDWSAIQALQEEGRNQAREEMTRESGDPYGIAAAVLRLYKGDVPELMPIYESTPLLIRTCITLIHWTSANPSDDEIEMYLTRADYDSSAAALAFQFAAARALDRDKILDAIRWLKELFLCTCVESAQMDIVRIALALCHWKQENIEKCKDILRQVRGEELPKVCKAMMADLSRRLRER